MEYLLGVKSPIEEMSGRVHTLGLSQAGSIFTFGVANGHLERLIEGCGWGLERSRAACSDRISGEMVSCTCPLAEPIDFSPFVKCLKTGNLQLFPGTPPALRRASPHRGCPAAVGF